MHRYGQTVAKGVVKHEVDVALAAAWVASTPRGYNETFRRGTGSFTHSVAEGDNGTRRRPLGYVVTMGAAAPFRESASRAGSAAATTDNRKLLSAAEVQCGLRVPRAFQDVFELFVRADG